jgi:nicotinamide-nucleotide adenylyltransferase
VLHNDHLRYLLSGKALCNHLVVGITNPDPFMTKDESVDPARSDPAANPLTYYERSIMMQQVLMDAGLNRYEFTVVPLPINLPERYRYYVPMDAVFFLSIYDDWGRRKLKYFQSLNLFTHVLREVSPDQKGISAKDVRRRMISGQAWEHLVPAGVAPLIRKWRIQKRLQQLDKGEI